MKQLFAYHFQPQASAAFLFQTSNPSTGPDNNQSDLEELAKVQGQRNAVRSSIEQAMPHFEQSIRGIPFVPGVGVEHYAMEDIMENGEVVTGPEWSQLLITQQVGAAKEYKYVAYLNGDGTSGIVTFPNDGGAPEKYKNSQKMMAALKAKLKAANMLAN